MNILVSKHYTVTDHTKWPHDRTREGNLEVNYGAMNDIMTASGRQNIADLDDVIVHTGEADNIRDVFKIHFYEIYELWKQGHNILYADSDVVFTRPVNYFGKFDKFMMFNFTDGGQNGTSCDHYKIKLKYFFNCGIRYYPAEMSQDIWDIGIKMVKDWNPNRWNSEQVIYNVMMWNQVFDKTPLLPELAYQYINPSVDFCNRFNNINITDAKAIHFHGSRGSENRLTLMKQYYQQ